MYESFPLARMSVTVINGNSMDLTNPNENQKLSPELWEAVQFPAKAFCELKEGHILNLKASPHHDARTLTTLGRDNYLDVLEVITAEFTNLEKEFRQLQQEWDETEDKLSLEDKLIRMEKHLHHASAAGNYTPLFEDIERKLAHIRSLYEANYKHKLEIVEQAEALAGSEDWKAASESWQRLTEGWKNGPALEKEADNQLWERFDRARHTFRERRQAFFKEKDKDQMRNLDLKLEICEEAERLAASSDWKKTTDAFKALFEQWKVIGAVTSKEKNELLWQRFQAARQAFFEQKERHYQQIKVEQEQHYEAKLRLVERAEELSTQTDWKAVSEAMAEIMEAWKKIGKVPYEKSNAIWERLQAARDRFFGARREQAEGYKNRLEENYKLKLELADRAEALKDSTQWQETTRELNEMMYTWKKSGPVPREYGDTLWERFIKARKHFFKRKDADREKRHERFHHQVNNRLHQTTQFLQKIREDFREDQERLEDFKRSLEATQGDSPKDEELRQHLKTLIHDIEKRLPGKLRKIEDVERQKEELTQKCREVNGKREGGKIPEADEGRSIKTEPVPDPQDPGSHASASSGSGKVTDGPGKPGAGTVPERHSAPDSGH